MTKWLTVDEIAQHLRTSSSTVYKLKERGEIRGYRVGRQLLFDPDEVDSDIKGRRKRKPIGNKRTDEHEAEREIS